jgi:hypothetical protein
MRLCLVGHRYAVDLVVFPDDETRSAPGSARTLSDRAGYFGFPSATGDPDLPEVVVKMLPDGTFGGQGAPIFYSSLTTVPYAFTVTDTVTGEEKQYHGNPANGLCGGADLAFAGAALHRRLFDSLHHLLRRIRSGFSAGGSRCRSKPASPAREPPRRERFFVQAIGSGSSACPP